MKYTPSLDSWRILWHSLSNSTHFHVGPGAMVQLPWFPTVPMYKSTHCSRVGMRAISHLGSAVIVVCSYHYSASKDKSVLVRHMNLQILHIVFSTEIHFIITVATTTHHAQYQCARPENTDKTVHWRWFYNKLTLIVFTVVYISSVCDENCLWQ